MTPPVDHAATPATDAAPDASPLTFRCLACRGSVDGIRAQLGSLTCDDCPRH